MNLENITKIYNQGLDNEVIALNNINLKFEEGKFYAIMGKSGSGKSTLINILGLLDVPTSGKFFLNQKDTSKLTENILSEIRNKNIGFVFQSYYLDDNLTALENIILPSLKLNMTKEERRKKARNLLEKMDISKRANHKPSELSGGEQQRVAIARALMNDPKYIIADEPTGNLDTKNEIKIFEYLKEISKEGKCVIVVTHNEKIKDYADILYEISDGELL